MPNALTPNDIDKRLAAGEIDADWSHDVARHALCRDFAFADFSEAFGFMARAALVAEKLDHHPDWTNAFSKISVCLSTHTAGGVTEKDFALARAMDAIARNLNA